MTSLARASDEDDDIAFGRALESWRTSLNRPDMGEEDRVRGAILAYRMQMNATRLWNEAKASPLPAPACGFANPSSSDCQNMKEVGGGFEGERYRCDVCGKGYFLDYEEMK